MDRMSRCTGYREAGRSSREVGMLGPAPRRKIPPGPFLVDPEWDRPRLGTPERTKVNQGMTHPWTQEDGDGILSDNELLYGNPSIIADA